ncbi:MAG TPA: nitroreductase [Clostridiaceae bacterium]|jgi:nitroreductase|nr:nitroreductase [Clostridiaceae bacterium]
MTVISAIENRRSIRKYTSQEVEDEKLNKVLEAARLSPSARNLQNWKFIVVRDPEKISELGKAAGSSGFIAQAPVIIAACGTDPEGIMRCGQHRHTVDLSIATAYIILAAYEQGLGTCWIGGFDEKMVKEILNVPDNVRVVAITPLGYPDESPAPRPRKKLEDIVCFETYKP